MSGSGAGAGGSRDAVVCAGAGGGGAKRSGELRAGSVPSRQLVRSSESSSGRSRSPSEAGGVPRLPPGSSTRRRAPAWPRRRAPAWPSRPNSRFIRTGTEKLPDFEQSLSSNKNPRRGLWERGRICCCSAQQGGGSRRSGGRSVSTLPRGSSLAAAGLGALGGFRCGRGRTRCSGGAHGAHGAGALWGPFARPGPCLHSGISRFPARLRGDPGRQLVRLGPWRCSVPAAGAAWPGARAPHARGPRGPEQVVPRAGQRVRGVTEPGAGPAPPRAAGSPGARCALGCGCPCAGARERRSPPAAASGSN